MNFGGIYLGVRKAWSVIKDVASANIDMIEANNLFEVSMGKVVDQYGNLNESASEYYTRALKFQNEMNERLATNRSELMKYQAMYFSMFKSQGIDKESSYKMSENLTKAGYDIASLYNLTVDEAMTKIKSGIAGQVEPLRTIGIDISESALTKVIRNAGISDRSVQQLSYAEKEVARYISIIEQAGQAQGDFAKTFEQPANQIRVFKNQLLELKQVAGAFITNTFGGIIVYANAIIMTIKEIIKSFATLLGYDLTSGGTNLSETMGVDDLNAGLSSGIGKAKELKKQLMGFDEINNIEPQNKSGGSGGGVTGGIDNKLLESLKEWENRMGTLTGKAQQIRDKMLEWLGFKRDDDGTWKLGEGYTKLELIKDIVIAIGLGILGWKMKNFIADLIKAIIKAGGLLGIVKSLKTQLGGAIGMISIYFYIDGLKGLLDGELTKENLMKAFGSSVGLGVSAGMLTGNWKLALVIAVAGISFSGGVAIGDWLKQHYQDSITWYIDKFDLDLNEDSLVEQVLKVTGIILGTIGDAILDGVNILWDSLPQWGKTTWRVVIGILTGGLTEIVILLVKNWNKISKFFKVDIPNFFSQTIPKWFEDHVFPWFTWEKWAGIGENVKNGLADKWNEFKDWWANTAIVQWWENHVAPWFTKEKWGQKAQEAKNSLQEKWNEFKENFKPFSDWFNKHVAPWFTKEKWLDLAVKSKDSVVSTWDSFKNSFNPISDWFNNKVAPWFTWEKWRQLGSNAVQAIQNAFSNFNFKIKLPHFTWSSQPANGWIANVLSALNLPTSLPKLNVSWYASGGMPDMGEIFVAREAGPEMVGRIGNKTTVANNDQIVTAIKQGVYEAVRSAMPNGSAVRLDIRADEGIIVKKASEGFAEYVMQTGELPFPVPVG